MRLQYRGNGYDYEPVEANSVETNLSGRYRWQPFQFSDPRHIPTPQTPQQLTYRGVDYQTDKGGEILPVVMESSSGAPAASLARASLKTRRALMRQVEQIHLQSIEKRLLHRIQVALERGDQTLVAQLEQEMSQMVCHL